MIQTVVVFSSFIVLCLGTDNGPIRSTIFGKIQGKITNRYPGIDVEEFLGVQYAEPPINSLRFKRPRDPTPWHSVKSTTILPPACPQLRWIYLNVHKPSFNRSSEDCLYMNIYVPRVDDEDLPVLLYVHGGSNSMGMGNMFDGDILAAFGHIIVVNFNYRLGVLGFYADRSAGIEGNLGLLDQVHAMKWIQKNIRYFNGDPNKITLHGHSAGAGDVGLHLVSNLTKGLFRYSIVHSGSPLALWGSSICIPTFRYQNVPTDCKPGTNYIKHTKTYSEMMEGAVDDYDFLSLMGEYLPLAPTEGSFMPVVDDYYLSKSPDKSLQCQPAHGESVLIAMARDEGFPLYQKFTFESFDTGLESIAFDTGLESIGYKSSMDYFAERFKGYYSEGFLKQAEKVFYEWLEKNTSTSSLPQALQMQSDVVFFAPMVKLADLISRWIDNVYLLSFEYVSQKLTGADWQGIPHGWDLFYVFGVPLVDHPVHNYTLRDVETSKATMRLFTNYVKYGFLTFDGKTKLGKYDSSLRSYNKLYYAGGRPVVTSEVGFRTERMDFWFKYLFKNTFVCNNAMAMICIYSYITLFVISLSFIRLC